MHSPTPSAPSLDGAAAARPTAGRRARALLVLAGSQCSFFLGAAFATGQESLQYFTSHGWAGIAMVAVLVVLFAWAMGSLSEWGRAHGTDRTDPYTDVAGRVLGTVFRVLMPLAVFSIAVMMVAGAGALVQDLAGWPAWTGSVLLTVMLVLTLALGFRGLVEVLGRLGPVLAVMLSVLGVWLLVRHGAGLAQAQQNLERFPPDQAVGHPLLSVLAYGLAMLCIGVPFLSSLGRVTLTPTRSTVPGAVLGAVLFGTTMLITSLVLLATLPLIHGSEAPLLVLGAGLAPWVALPLTVVAFLGVYTTAAPMIWTVTDQLPLRSVRAERTVSVLLALVALVLGLSFDFSSLVGGVYPIVGVAGGVFFGLLLIRQLLGVARRRRG